ncbi:TBCC [Symbiodinium natans]|uniref:TBCC protein n=1 Tax=Symbiodinium natans TaxID=878477 RepID=A0A812IP63_9DINO|nr:TBCC [Symbiodinium natans]
MDSSQRNPTREEEFLKDFFRTFKADEAAIRDALGAVESGGATEANLWGTGIHPRVLEPKVLS